MANNGEEHEGGKTDAGKNASATKSEIADTHASMGALEPIAFDEPDMRLDPAAQMLIGQTLKALYSEIVHEPIPDRLAKLLAELDRDD